MGRIKVEDHERLRKWCSENQVSDPEDLVARNKDGSITFKSAHSGKSYRRIEKMYRDARRPAQ